MDHSSQSLKPTRRGTTKQPKPISLALQGGGSHGAFTWGVLDRLLEDERIVVEAISGTSAGAMNAVALADGLQKSGRTGARAALHAFWQDVSRSAALSMIQRTPWDKLTGSWSLNHSPGYLISDLLTRLASPYELNPFNINPQQDFLREHVDFDAVHSCTAVKLFISATNVRTGRVRIFTNRDLSPAAMMASACLPNLFSAVEIDGEGYWDGGYAGNPALHPLIYNYDVRDIIIVPINPIDVPEIPKTARDILDRVYEITFNSSLLAGLRAFPAEPRREAGFQLDQVQRGRDPDNWKPMDIVGLGVREIRIRDASGAFRVSYAAKLGSGPIKLLAGMVAG